MKKIEKIKRKRKATLTVGGPSSISPRKTRDQILGLETGQITRMGIVEGAEIVWLIVQAKHAGVVQNGADFGNRLAIQRGTTCSIALGKCYGIESIGPTKIEAWAKVQLEAVPIIALT